MRLMRMSEKLENEIGFALPGEAWLRSPKFSKKILAAIKRIARSINYTVKIMHVCGTHEHVICENGFRPLLPKNLEIISGPGCPVCVCPAIDIDRAIALAKRADVILSTFGDMIRVPSSRQSLMEQKAKGSDIRVVYGPSEAIKIALDNPEKEVVFFSIGFETTAPLPALELTNKPPDNFSILCAHKTIPPAMELIVGLPDIEIDGFITPGHVAVILGEEPFKLFSDAYRYTNVITGFEPNDLLLGIFLTLKQIKENDPKTINEYSRIVKPEGNKKARKIMYDVFEPETSRWRGIGKIRDGGLKIKDKYADYDALKKFNIEIKDSIDIPLGCSCHLVLTGKMKPKECPLFGKGCTPLHPVGPCMVSHEGTCKIAYTFKDVTL
ncbi:MAG: hydrogenase formation protein HypD [Candidatus Lokiarchaeota archaeon]|nr:hydrogenase formation protein HypD [Candidatus Lokiarchaeota archaeon]